MNKTIQKYDFKQGLPQEFEILNIAQLYKDFEVELTTPHRAEFYQILWFKKGNSTHLVDFNPVKIQPNTLLFINKNSVQKFDKTFDSDGISMLFTDNFFCKTPEDTKFLKSSILFNDLYAISKIHISSHTNIFDDLFKLLELELVNNNDQYQSEVLQNYLRNFLLLAERERKKQDFIKVEKDADLDFVMHFKDLLENQFQHLKTVNNYASQMHITLKRLNKATSKIMGKTPKQLIDDRIILEAKRLLAHTNQSVKEIGFIVGFDEPTNFIKYFRKHYNATPLEFRDQFSH